MIKIYTAGFETRPMDILHNFTLAQSELSKAIAAKCDIIVFPQGFLLGAPLGLVKDAEYLQELYNSCVDKLCRGIWLSRIRILCDNLTQDGFKSFVSYQGHPLEEGVFTIDKISVCPFAKIDELFAKRDNLRDWADLFILNSSTPTVAGQLALEHQMLKSLAMSQGVCFALCLGGNGYSSHPYFYTPCVGIISKTQDCAPYDYRSFHTADFVYETEITRSLFTSKCHCTSADFEINFNQNPMLPTGVEEKDYCLDLFDMQGASLAVRMKNIGCKNVVLNLSGGLDSTLALLVCVNTFDMLGLNKSGLQVVTMPGFGTSNTTKSLASRLCETLGLPLKTIDISPACTQALADLHHDGVTADGAFENVQARMRTLYALTLANMCNGLMVGTGDLSEAALGFCTYGGDGLASYNVNCCVAKTILRTMLPHITRLPLFTAAAKIVEEILALPVSPELVPHGGEILQKTEELLAPYKLIDFFIYCLVGAKISPKQTLEKACDVFSTEFEPPYIKEKLELFYTRFAQNQFKRSCAPESAIITHINLLGSDNFYCGDGGGRLFLSLLNN